MYQVIATGSRGEQYKEVHTDKQKAIYAACAWAWITTRADVYNLATNARIYTSKK